MDQAISYIDSNCQAKIISCLNRRLKQDDGYEKLIFLCVGTDKCIGDSFGPAVGSYIKKLEIEYESVKVMGTLENPLHALNMFETVDILNQSKSEKTLVIAVDAYIGRKVGDIVIKDTGIYPGIGFGKNLPHIGDISILGTVCKSWPSILRYTYLNNVKQDMVRQMAFVTANAIKGLIYDYYNTSNKICDALSI